MTIEPKRTKREAQPYAGIREKAAREELAERVPRTLSELHGFLEEHGIGRIGPPLVRYLVVDYNTDEVEVDVGAPVQITTLPADERVRVAQIPAGTFVTVIHRGRYDALMETTAALLAWAKETDVAWQVAARDNVTRWGARVEHYLVGPPDEPDPAKWVTEIAIMIAADDN